MSTPLATLLLTLLALPAAAQPAAADAGTPAPQMPETMRRFVRDAELQGVVHGVRPLVEAPADPGQALMGQGSYVEQAPRSPLSRAAPRGGGVNPTVETEDEPASTFTADADASAYAVARASLARGALPPEAAIRVEGFVNAFDYGERHEAGADGAPFTLHAEAFPSPARPGYHVLRLGLQAEADRQERRPAHLVVVVDTSGSMNAEDRLGLVRRALAGLVDALAPDDVLSLVSFGGDARVLLRAAGVADRAAILAAVDALRPSGVSGPERALEMAYALALAHGAEGAARRVVLCTDGVTGVGPSDPFWIRVRERSERGLALSTLGLGLGETGDPVMERLAQVGGGEAAYAGTLPEAQRMFLRALTGTRRVVARDVRLQVELDPAVVRRYRLLGYEGLAPGRTPPRAAGAGEVAAGHAVTALYEVKLAREGAALGALRIRFTPPAGGAPREVVRPLPASLVRAQASAPARLALVSAVFAEKLRQSYWARDLTWERLEALWGELPEGVRARPQVAELGALIARARALDVRPPRATDDGTPPVVR